MRWPSSRLKGGPSFAAKCPADKRYLITQLKACKRCSSWIHEASRCTLWSLSCMAKKAGRKCGGSHIQELHDCLWLPPVPEGPECCAPAEGGPIRYSPGPAPDHREPQATPPEPQDADQLIYSRRPAQGRQYGLARIALLRDYRRGNKRQGTRPPSSPSSLPSLMPVEGTRSLRPW